MDRIIKNKTKNQKILSFNKIRKFSSFKNLTMNKLNTIIKKLKNSALSNNFTSFVSKNIKDMGNKAPHSKKGGHTLTKSKSQDFISSSKSFISSG